MIITSQDARKKASLLKNKVDARQKEDQQRLVIIEWFKNQSISWSDLEKTLKILIPNPLITLDRRSISKLVLQYDYNSLDANILNDLNEHIKDRESIIAESLRKEDNSDKIEVILAQHRRFLNNSTNKPIQVHLKKSRLFLQVSITQISNNLIDYQK